MLTQAQLKHKLYYDPIVGVWIRRNKNFAVKMGTFANFKNHLGYRVIKINGKSYLSSRLAFLYMTGQFPPKGILVDHINRNRFDDSWKNLRQATYSQNSANTGINPNVNKTGYKGIVQCPQTGYWIAALRKSIGHIGSYKTKEEAAKAYDIQAILTYGDFAELNFDRSQYPENPVHVKKILNNNNTSGFRGVILRSDNLKYRVGIYHPVLKKRENIGTFTDPIEAALAYDKRAMELYGKRANLNFG